MLGGASVVEGIMLVLLGEIVLGIFSLDRLLRPKSIATIEHITPEADILKRAREMQGRADRSVHCIWCAMDYDVKLRKYFDDVRGITPVVHRLVNVTKRPKDVSAHLTSFVAEIKAGKYVVTSTKHEAFEFLIADKSEIMILVPYATKDGFSEGFYSTDVDFANAIFHMYDDLMKQGKTLHIPLEADEEVTRQIIEEWVEAGTQ